MANKPHVRLGAIARQLCWLFDGVVVGNAIDYLQGLSDEPPSDIDIIIPLDKWIEASKLMPLSSRANSFGGFKFKDRNHILDVWADDVVRLMYTGTVRRAYIPKTGQVVSISEK